RKLSHLCLTGMAFALSILLFIYQNSQLFNSILVYFIVFALAWAVYRWITKQQFHDKFIVYRALAENLRILFYLRLLNRYPASPFESHWKRNEKFDWINAAATKQLRICLGTASPLPLNQALQLVRRHWVDGQAEYYWRQAARQEHIHTKQHNQKRRA